MSNKPLVTICMHTGKLDNYPLVENFLKSFLICNFYENIELMLIESAGNKEIREWFEKLNFNECFENFSGIKSSIKKREGVRISKKLKFYDYPETHLWFECYTESIQKAINEASGEFFCLFAEDNQFTVSGNIIEDYIKILEKENNFKSLVHFFGQQKYKLYKANNFFEKTPTLHEGIEYFKPKHKWDFFSLTRTENYKNIGPLAKSTKEKPHNTVSDYSRRTENKGYVRVYPKIPHGLWFHNNDNDKIIKEILKNKNNPDYVYYKISSKSFLVNASKHLNMPLATDDFKGHTN